MSFPNSGTENIFAVRPIMLAGFCLRAYGAEAIGTPTLSEWNTAFLLATSSQESSAYWVGDLLAYADTRAEWRAKIDQAKSLTGLAHKTLLNQTWVCRHVKEPQRKLAATFGHAQAVAPLEADEQEELLVMAHDKGWNSVELQRAVRRHGRALVVEGQAESMRTVDVSVRVIVEAPSPWHAQEKAWALVKTALAAVPHAHVIGATALETVA